MRIPTLYWPGFNYYFWEIPLVAAFLLLGFKVAFSITVLNNVARLLFFPGQAPLLGFITGFMPLLTVLLGVYLAKKFIELGFQMERQFLRLEQLYFTRRLGLQFVPELCP